MRTVDMVVELRDRLGERESFDTTDTEEWRSADIGNFWRNDFLVRKLEEGQRRFNRAAKWNWLLTLRPNIAVPAGTEEVELIDDVDTSRHSVLRLVKDSDPNHIIIPEKVSAYRGFHLLKDLYTPGDPNYYFPIRTVVNVYEPDEEDQHSAPAVRLRLVPVPDAAYTAEFGYYRNPLPLTRLGEPDMPEEYQDAVLAWAEFKAWQKERTNSASKAAEDALGEYQAIVQEALAAQEAQLDNERIMWGSQPPRVPLLSREEWQRAHVPGPIGV